MGRSHFRGEAIKKSHVRVTPLLSPLCIAHVHAKDRGFKWCRTSEVKYMGAWHRVSNKNQPNNSSIKFLKNRDFFIVVRRLHLSKALWNCLRRLHHLSKGCGIVSLVYISYRKGVFKKIRLVKLFLRVF